MGFVVGEAATEIQQPAGVVSLKEKKSLGEG